MNATTTPAPTFAGRTADEWREMARQSEQDAADSFERCDTDGFLSQWASQSMARTYRRNASVAERGGMIEMEAPVIIATGDVIHGRWVDGQYGAAFYADQAVDGKRYFNPSFAKDDTRRRANDAKKGIEFRLFLVPAYLDNRTGEAEVDLRSDVPWTDQGHTYGEAPYTARPLS